MRFEALLGRTTRAFWATSYAFDLKLFDQYLLRRLAQSPLNAVVLADHDKLATVWDGLREGQEYLAKQVGRRYLLRGIRIPSGGAFHPKTYLFGRADHATLLVGSGNLTRPGIDHGREIFVAFTTQREEHLPSMRSWSQWMGRLVHAQADQLLSERWTALREASAWMTGDTPGSEFVANDERSLLEQLVERLPGAVDELHVTAPFFDQHGSALHRLIDECDPKKVTVYVGEGVSVHGPSLAALLSARAGTRLRRFEPRTFVHAKLIGATKGDIGVLLSGSPNLSQAALTSSSGSGGFGNSEAAVIRDGSADEVRQVFEGSGLELVDEPLESLTSLVFDDAHPSDSHLIALAAAQWRKDGRIKLSWAGEEPLPAEAHLSWDGASELASLTSDGTTTDPQDEAERLPILVFLVDAAGDPISNRVVVDDPQALRETLVGSASKSSSKPPELEGVEMVPLVRLVLWANDKLIFDADENAAFKRAQDAVGEMTDVEDATGFWERLATEELQYDPRLQSYKPLTVSGATATPVDELLRELKMLLHAAPTTDLVARFKVLTVGGSDDDGDHGTGVPWSMEARQRVRAFNILLRWANALSDPRHALVAPQAPVVNYETLIGIILMAWVNDALETKQVRKLLLTATNAFIGAGPGQGFLGRIDDKEKSAALDHLAEGYVEIGAGMVFVALSGPGWQEDIYDWQPALRAGIEHGVLLPGKLSESVAAQLAAEPASTRVIDELLARRVDWVDEVTWCRRLAKELDLNGVRIESRNAKVKLGVVVQGCADPLTDTRLLTVARRALDFKKETAIAISAGDNAFVFEPGGRPRARIGGHTVTPSGTVDLNGLREIEDQGGSWADLLGIGRVEAAA